MDPALTIIQLHLAEAYIASQKKLKAKAILQRLISEQALKRIMRMMMEKVNSSYKCNTLKLREGIVRI